MAYFNSGKKFGRRKSSGRTQQHGKPSSKTKYRRRIRKIKPPRNDSIKIRRLIQ